MNKFITGLILAAALAPGPAGAIVGGAEDKGALSRSGIMLVTRTGMCSGIVVAPDVVLTAGHCVAGSRDYRVHYRSGTEPVLLAPAARAVHPGYNAKAVENRRPSVDLALVRLPGPLPAAFEVATLGTTAPAKGTVLSIGGYGVAESDDPRSTGTFRVAPATAIEPYGPSRILLWGEGRRAGACQGDSGGPMAVGTEVVAVTGWSAAANGRGCGGLTQGILLGPQREWIDRTLSGWGRAAQWR